MNARFGTIAFLSLLFAGATFVWHTSASLPPVVASHFGSNGAADGFMPRDTYVAMMLVIAVGLPLLIAFLPGALASRGGKNLNIPHREYWLAPERRENTITFLRLHGQWFAAALALFLGHVHWLVVQANMLRPPQLSTFGMVAGLVAFFVFLGSWLVVLFARFRRPA